VPAWPQLPGLSIPSRLSRGLDVRQMDKTGTAATANALLWVVTVLAAAALRRDSDQVLMLIVVPVADEGVSISVIEEAARPR
jgi:hypothetical protein